MVVIDENVLIVAFPISAFSPAFSSYSPTYAMSNLLTFGIFDEYSRTRDLEPAVRWKSEVRTNLEAVLVRKSVPHCDRRFTTCSSINPGAQIVFINAASEAHYYSSSVQLDLVDVG